MYRVRFHGRGGQGIKTAGRILGSAFFRAGYEVQDAPVYGAERRGAPVFSCVRAGREPIRERGLIEKPDLVVVADDTLIGVPAANVMLGLGDHTVVLVYSTADVATWRSRLVKASPVIILPAPAARERTDASLAGVTCAGAAARMVGAISRQNLDWALREELSALGPDMLGKNLTRGLTAFESVAAHAGIVEQSALADASDYAAPEWIDVPLESARTSAPDIYAAASSVEVRTGLWRTMRPEIDYARCNHCTWICSTYCPDSAIAIRNDGAPEVDFDHCKGCMICVAVCPPHAIGGVPEHATPAISPVRGDA